jgi:hypothetical protein
MIQVTNGGAELVVVRGGVTSTYLYSSFKSISWFEANNGNYIVVITFLTDPAGSVPLKLSLNDVDNQPTWTNDVSGSEGAVKDISSWVSLAIAPATGLATEVTLLSVDSNAAQLVTNTTSILRTPGIASLTGAGLTTAGVYSFSIANVGSANGLVGGESIPAGMTISFDGGALNNTLGSISYDATGTTFIITYIS